jgi:hypothetical protein
MLSKPTNCINNVQNANRNKKTTNRNQMANMNKKSLENKRQTKQKPIAKKGGRGNNRKKDYNQRS